MTGLVAGGGAEVHLFLTLKLKRGSYRQLSEIAARLAESLGGYGCDQGARALERNVRVLSRIERSAVRDLERSRRFARAVRKAR